ncbi:MAG TPA: hypothetical protein VMQ93_03305 [Novosphingobium sp.]|nr:hypothetical protein [Novosphingobium sp.]
MAPALPLAADGLTVSRARLGGPGANRSLLEDALGAVAMDGLGLAPGEVLYIPRLRPPGRLRAGQVAPFAHGIALRLGELARSAQRDPAGSSAADRPCRFSTRAAFAAWLIGCVVETRGGAAREIVRAATRHGAPDAWWRGEVLGDGALLVPVIARLSQARMAARWVASLPPSDVKDALATVAQHYALSPVIAVPQCIELRGDAAPHQGARSSSPAVSRSARDTAHSVVLDAFDGIVSREEEWSRLAMPARQLLLAAITLATTPSLPRAQLATAIAETLAAPGLSEGPADVPEQAPRAGGAARANSPQAPHRQDPRSASPLASRPLIEQHGAKRSGTVRGQNYRPIARAIDTRRTEGASPPAAASPRDSGHRPTIADEASPQTVALPGARTAFDSGFGGLAFLLNAFRELGFHPDFTRPRDPALDISPLHLADRLGLHWFGAAYRRDPLHRWIVESGPRATPPSRWQVERDWLTPFAEGFAHYERGVLWHSAGFPLASPGGPISARRAARRLGLQTMPMPATAHGACPPDWSASLALFLSARFRQTTVQGDLTPRALAIPARCVPSEGRLDVHFALARLPLSLRIAGLDRDPGWSPAEGRDIRFHFA